jgi:nucleoside 2-deoxyribosyltransferase
MKKKIYIAGKVTGLPQDEVSKKFSEAEDYLEQKGFNPVNPIHVVCNVNASWQEAMKKCIAALMECDGILALPDVLQSKGAKLEMKLARKLGIPVFESGWLLSKHFE